jgi:hypothetical protein
MQCHAPFQTNKYVRIELCRYDSSTSAVVIHANRRSQETHQLHYGSTKLRNSFASEIGEIELLLTYFFSPPDGVASFDNGCEHWITENAMAVNSA